MSCRLSVIVPVYNGERYLEKCVSSICSQSERNIEIILVDDGSTDSSGNICDALKEKDRRIHVIHQKNSGVSAARNAGIASATGDYIGFVDSDDTIESQMFEKMLETAEKTNSDIVMCDAVTVFSDGRTQADTITQLSENRILKKSDFTPTLLLEIAGSAWRCIYKKCLLNAEPSNGITVRFPLGVKFSEDRIFNIYAMGYANQVAYIKEPYYNRLIHDESCVMSFHEDYYERVKLAHRETVVAIRKAWDDNPDYQKAYLKHYVGGVLGAINNYWYKTSTLNMMDRKQKMRSICDDEELRKAISSSAIKDIRCKLILNRRINMLAFTAILLNKKSGR